MTLNAQDAVVPLAAVEVEGTEKGPGVADNPVVAAAAAVVVEIEADTGSICC